MSPVATAAPAWTIPGFLDVRENNHLFISGVDATDRKSTRLNSSHSQISYAVSLFQKNTRLNSSHSQISYAVFCLKKKTSKLQSQSNIVCRLMLEKNKMEINHREVRPQYHVIVINT